jgi:hypothetical protein
MDLSQSSRWAIIDKGRGSSCVARLGWAPSRKVFGKVQLDLALAKANDKAHDVLVVSALDQLDWQLSAEV